MSDGWSGVKCTKTGECALTETLSTLKQTIQYTVFRKKDTFCHCQQQHIMTSALWCL